MSRMISTLTLGAALLVAPAVLASQPGQGAPRDASTQGPRPMQGPRGQQGPHGPRGAMHGPNDANGLRGLGAQQSPITHLLNARRQLDLTPRQVAQLDSLERLQYAEHEQFTARLRGARDSIVTRAPSGDRTPAARDSMQARMRARMEAERPQLDQRRRRDSSMSAAAERILNDTQRQRAREMQAERRGYERGRRESRAPRAGQRGGMARNERR